MIDSIELFCGAGGLALGLQKAGLNHKALFEWDNIPAPISTRILLMGIPLSQIGRYLKQMSVKLIFKFIKGPLM